MEPSADAVLVQDFANTRDLRSFIPRGHPHRDGTADDIASPESLRAWLVSRELLPVDADVSEADHQRTLAFRAALRAALDQDESPEPQASPPITIPLQVVLAGGEAPRLTAPGGAVDQAIGGICAAALRTALTGEWWRLRACAAEDCHWVFYDQSRPGRGRYCAPETCGNRVKTREYRRRKAATRAH